MSKVCVLQECSSDGRAPVSKTEGRGFDPLRSCKTHASTDAGVAQLVEHPLRKRMVGGSNPSTGTIGKIGVNELFDRSD